MLLILGLGALAMTSALLFLAGADKNASVTRLRTEAVAVEMTVGGCQGLLGGSGSNAAGYSCWGTFTLAGHRYRENIPGDALLAPGTQLRVFTVPGDPGLLETPQALATDHASAQVYVLPAVLIAVLAAGVVVLAVRRRLQPVLRSPLGRGGRGARLGEVAGGV